MELPRQNPPQVDDPSSDLSDRTFSSSSTFIQTPFGSTPHRGKYESIPDEEEDISHKGVSGKVESAHGLRISFKDHDVNHMSLPATVKSTPEVPGSERELLSSCSARSKHQSLLSPRGSPCPDDQYFNDGRYSIASIRSPYSLYGDDESTRGLGASTIGSKDLRVAQGELQCGTKRPIKTSRMSWISITFLILSIYSTAFSAIFLGLAVTRPRYHSITHNGPFSFSTASLLSTAFAKTIELSFVTVFVAALGQRLTSIARQKKSKGISVADMLLRQWIQQPGSLITHWESVRYASVYLKVATIAATVLSMLYTTASDALVAPKLKFGGEDRNILQGEVKTMFANNSYQMQNCKTPITVAEDADLAGQTCMELEHSGQAYHNYMQFLPQWSDFRNRTPEGSTKMNERPPPVGMLWDNTTLWGQWVEETDVANKSAEHNRLINNVTLAMPLTAVVNAAKHQKNRILQPLDSKGLGEYYVHASVPSPSINVLCAAVTEEELDPLVYVRWPIYELNSTKPNASTWPLGFDDKIPHMPSFLNKTAVDDVFGWGEQYGRRHPVFSIVPKVFKTVLNSSSEISPDGYRSDSVYVLATSNATNSSQICSIRASIYPHCSTRYHASISGGNLTAHCNEPGNDLQYSVSRPEVRSGVPNFNWTEVSNRWVTTMGLGGGINDNPTTNARLLSQLMLNETSLNPQKPSIAEALAVQAGCTIINPALDSPLIHYWNQPNQSHLDAPFWQSFNATILSQEYSSGGTQAWQGLFYVVLVGTLLLNVACLIYFLGSQGLITDFMEPHNLFALAINSPPSRALEGACGAGPEKEQWHSKWHIDEDVGTNHFYIQSLDEPMTPSLKRRKGMANKDSGWEMQFEDSPDPAHLESLSKKPSSLF